MGCVRAGLQIREKKRACKLTRLAVLACPRGLYVLARAKFPGHLEAKQAFKCQFHIRKEGRKS